MSLRKSRSEEGIYIPFLVILICTLLAVVGLVIDSGNLYRTRIRMQRAADAGAIGGLGYRTLYGWRHFNPEGTLGVKGKNDKEVEDRAIELVRANLDSMRFHPSRYVVTASFSSATDKLTVNIVHDENLFILGYVPGQAGCSRLTGDRQTCQIKVTAETQLSPANIGLLLDTSGSMACPTSTPSGLALCQCRKTASCDTDFPEANDQVIEVLNSAVDKFVYFFNPNRDRIGIYPYNVISDPQFFSIHETDGTPRPFGKDQATYDAFNRKVDSLIPVASTNYCDVLQTAYNDIDTTRPAIFNKENSFLVFFTDGAPSAGTFAYSNRRRYLDDYIVDNQLVNEWVQYIIEWTYSGISYLGPSPLIFKGSMPFNSVSDIPENNPKKCGELVKLTREYDRSVGACLNSLTFVLPSDANKRPRGSGVPLPAEGRSEYIEQYYHCAIERTDQFRERGTTVYTISLGVDPVSDADDPYQNVEDVNARKNVFLRRLSFDSLRATADPDFKPRRISLKAPDPRAGTSVSLGYDEYRGYSDISVGNTRGESLGTSNPNELEALFSRVAKTILLRLTK